MHVQKGGFVHQLLTLNWVTVVHSKWCGWPLGFMWFGGRNCFMSLVLFLFSYVLLVAECPLSYGWPVVISPQYASVFSLPSNTVVHPTPPVALHTCLATHSCGIVHGHLTMKDEDNTLPETSRFCYLLVQCHVPEEQNLQYWWSRGKEGIEAFTTWN
jgi:hypothetical protein